MILLDVISALDSFDEGDTIYCRKPWSRDAVALVAPEPEAGGLPSEASRLGLSYFLEVAIAKEAISGWIANTEAAPSLEQICDRVISYATNDA
jgi:hypothetical protein